MKLNEDDFSWSQEIEDDYYFNHNKMNITMIKSALVSGVLAGILAGAVYIIGVGDVFALNLHSLVNVVAIAVLTVIVSLIKNIGTSSTGSFAGVQVK